MLLFKLLSLQRAHLCRSLSETVGRNISSVSEILRVDREMLSWRPDGMKHLWERGGAGGAVFCILKTKNSN